jgi:predicted DNA-binding transcriptional regulator AlpA
MDTTYLDEKSFCERFHVSRRTAQRWRVTGEGPPFVRIGPRRLLYRLADCEAWAAAQTYLHRAAELALTATR